MLDSLTWLVQFRRAEALAGSHRRGISLKDLVRLFPDELAAREWLEGREVGRHRAILPQVRLARHLPRQVGETPALPLAGTANATSASASAP